MSTPYCVRGGRVRVRSSQRAARRGARATLRGRGPKKAQTHLLLVLRLEARPGEFPLLAHGDKRGPEAEREHGAKEEPARVEPDDRVDLGVRVARRLAQGGERHGREVVQEVGDEGLSRARGDGGVQRAHSEALPGSGDRLA